MSSDARSPPSSSLVKEKKKKSKDKPRKAQSSSEVHGKDEGTNPDWDYVPPEGAVLVDHDVDSGDFDWDEVKNNDDLELWLVRAPAGVNIALLGDQPWQLNISPGETKVFAKCADRCAHIIRSKCDSWRAESKIRILWYMVCRRWRSTTCRRRRDSGTLLLTASKKERREIIQRWVSWIIVDVLNANQKVS